MKIGLATCYQRLVSRLRFVSQKIFNENVVAAPNIKQVLTLHKPAYVGMCTLDIWKTFRYDSHYCYMKVKYGGKAKIFIVN